MSDHYPLPLQGRDERRHLYQWVAEEEDYVAAKFDDQRNGHDETLRDHDLASFWSRQILQYLDRASLFLAAARSQREPHSPGPSCGEDHQSCIDQARYLEMKAQQALAKAMMTAKGCVESSIRVYGPLPAPGVSSGEVVPWQ